MIKHQFAAFVKPAIPLLGSCLLISACNFFDTTKQFFSQMGEKANGDNKTHSGSDSKYEVQVTGCSRRKNVYKTEKSDTPSNIILITLPADRCKSGTITFGPVDGERVTCSVLGRGVTRWDANDPPPFVENTTLGLNLWKEPAGIKYECLGRKYRTTVNDWEPGESESGKRCWFLKKHKTCGATPVGEYGVGGFSRAKNSNNPLAGGTDPHWGKLPGINITPRGGFTSRSGFLMHTDGDFDKDSFVGDFPHSSAGCPKVEPSCQKRMLKFVQENKSRGLKVIVTEEKAQK